MADNGNIGSAWVDVSLRFAEFEKGLKEVEKRAKQSAKKVEESFMVKYTKGFMEKETTRAAENAVKNQAKAAKEMADWIEVTKKRIADEIRAEEELEKIESERLRIILNINEEMDEQVRSAMQLSRVSKQALDSFPMPEALVKGKAGKFGFATGGGGGAGGLTSNQANMNAAQLSYAIQDFATGLSMGNFNMAVMGASNNLGMLAMSINPLVAGFTVIAASLIPSAIKALDALDGHSERAARGIDQINFSWDRLRKSMSKRKEMEQFQMELKNITSPEGIDQTIERLEFEKKQAAQDAADIRGQMQKDRQAMEGKIFETSNTKFIRAALGTFFGGKAGAFEQILAGGKVSGTEEEGLEILKKRKQAQEDFNRKVEDEQVAQQKINDAMAKRLEIQSKFASKMRSDLRMELGTPLQSANERAARELEERLKDIYKNAPKDQQEALADQARQAHRDQRQQNEENDKAAKRRLDLEMKPFATSAQHARLRAQEEYERNVAEIRKRYKNNPEEMAKKEADAKRKLDADNKEIAAGEEKRRRHLQTQIMAGIDQEKAQRMAIQDELKDRIEEINKMDIDAAEKAKLIAQAQRSARNQMNNIGPQGQFVGIGDLGRQVQMGLKNAVDLTVTNQELADILTAIKNQNLGAGA